MNDINIFFSEDNELVELDVIESECRGDVVVKIGNCYYHPLVITPSRLNVNFNIMVKKYGFYECNPCLVLVKNLKKETIIETILKLYNNDYFSQIKPINFERFCSIYEILSKDINEWIKVY